MMNRCIGTLQPMSEVQIAPVTVTEDHTMQKKQEEQEAKRLWGQKEQERLLRVTREKETQKQRKQKEAERLRKQLEAIRWRKQQKAKQLRKQKEAQYNKEDKDLKPYVRGNKLWKKRELTKQLDERSHELLSEGKVLQRNRVRLQQTPESSSKIPDNGQ